MESGEASNIHSDDDDDRELEEQHIDLENVCDEVEIVETSEYIE